MSKTVTGTLASKARLFRSAVQGNALLTTAFLLIPMLGMVGLGTDTAQWYLWKAQLQAQADSAALAGAYAVAQGKTGTSLASVVNTDLELNKDRAYTVVAIENAPTAGIKAGNSQAVRVVLSTQERLPFSSLFLASPPSIRVAATAEFSGVPQTCVLALLNAAGTGLSVSGSATVDLGCAMMSNATGALSMTTGSGAVNASHLRAAGGIVVGSGVSSTTVIQQNLGPQRDVFNTLPDPSWLGVPGYGNATVNSNQTRNLNPGYYNSLDIRGTANLAPGIYYIGAGGLLINGGGVVTGTGVTFVMTSNASTFDASKVGSARIAGNATVKLTAPTSGPYTGVLMYRDRRATADTSGTSMVIAGDSSSLLRGAIYAPTSNLTFTGTSGLDTACAQIVARTVAFSGNSAFRNVCPPNSGAGAFGGGASARLVE